MLNELLYSRLKALFGRNGVKVVNEGVPMDPLYERTAERRYKSTGIVLVDVMASGEEFHVNCPICNESRQRLSINHTWGVYDSNTHRRNWWCIQCWNCHWEGEKDKWKNIERLRRRIYEDLLSRRSMVVLNKSNTRPGPSGPVRLPGLHWRLDQLQKQLPYHEAIQFLEQRLLDPAYIGETFNVGFCPEVSEAANQYARRRIVAPVYLDGKLKAWTARYVGEPPDKSIGKWVHSRGQISRTLYNFDAAIKHPTIVITEGPADVWSFGIQSVAVFKSTISKPQLELLRKRCQPGTSLVVLLDPKMSEEDEKKGKEHHIERAYKLLSGCKEFQGRVVKVYLPGGRDPGDMDRWYMRDFIKARAKEQEVRVSFSRPKGS
jgi:hypothetical protein